MGNIIGTSVSKKLVLKNRTDLETVSGGAVLEESISTILITRSANRKSREGGVRVFRRNIGLNLARFLFKSDNPTIRAQMVQEILRINMFEPRIRFSAQDVQISKDVLIDPYLWNIRIRYTIVSTGETKNQVFPIFAKERFAQVLPVITLPNVA